MKLLLFLVAIIFSSAVVFNCSDGNNANENGSEPESEPELSAQEILERAAEESSNLESFHFVLTHENGSTPLPLNLELVSAEGDVVVPGRLQAEIDAEAAGFNVTVDVVGIDDQTWVTNPFTRRWQELEGTNIGDFADPAVIVSDLLPAVRDPQLEGEADLGGVETYRITGTLDSAVLQDALGGAEAGRDVPVEAWIGTEDFLPRRVRILGPVSDTDAENVARQVDLSNFNQPVSIEPPE